MIDRDRLLETFYAEARECLDELELNTLALADTGDEPILRDIFRRLHTLKGSGSCVGLDAITRAAHHAEDAVGAAINAHRGGDPALAGLLLHAVDLLGTLVADATHGRDDASDARIAQLGERCAAWVASKPAIELAPSSQAQVAALDAPSRTIRVEVSRLDRAMEIAAGLTIARGRLAEAFARRDFERASEAIEATDGLVRELEMHVLELRLVPLRASFDRLRRAVHDLGEATGKAVQLVVRCDDVEVDMAVAEALHAPLTHLLRNAIDHGIESPDERERAGKPRDGHIVISASHAGGQLVVEVADDGRGLDRERLLARGAAMGLAVDQLTDEQTWELAFVAGLSTAKAVGDLSGRGIGMDVARRSVEALRGSLRLHSVAGRGVTATIHLPLALSIIHGLAVGVGAEVFVLPVDSVIECVELDDERAIHSARGGVLELRGEALPYLRVGDHFGVAARRGDRATIVVVEHEGSRAGFEVDSLVGEVQTVIKPMGKLFSTVAGIAGSAVLGDGRIALVVDVRAVSRAVATHGIAA